MMSTSLKGNPYVNFLVVALMELPACFLFIRVVDKSGRKAVCRLFFIIGGCGILLSGLFKMFDGEWMDTIPTFCVKSYSLNNTLSLSAFPF